MADDKKPKKHKRKSPSLEYVEAAEPGPSAAQAREVATVAAADLNHATLGQLMLHFPERDVTILLDGATAARVVAAFAEPWRRALLQDRIHIDTSPMTNLWSSFDLARLLGVSWIPGLPSRSSDRMTVDPPMPDAAAATT